MERGSVFSMKNNRFIWTLILSWILSISLLGQGYDGASLTGTNINLNGQFQWAINSGADSPEGCYYMSVATNSATMVIPLGVTLSPGVWYFQLKTIDYDYWQIATFVLGGGSNSSQLSDRDISRWLQRTVPVTNSVATNQLVIYLSNTNNFTKCRISALYWTTNAVEDIDPNGKDTVYKYSYPSNFSTNVTSTRNLLMNSSFESGMSGWRPSYNNRLDSLTNWVVSGDAAIGNKALRFEAAGLVYSPYFYPREDSRAYNISVYWKGNGGTLYCQSAIDAPTNMTATASNSIALPNVAVWSRTNFSMVLPDYPVGSPYVIKYYGNINVKIDGLMVVEGTNLPTYMAMDGLELCWSNSRPSGVYFTNESAKPYVIASNSSGSNRTVSVYYEFWNHWNNLVSSGTSLLTLTNGEVGQAAITLPTQCGWYRGMAWADGIPPQEVIIVHMPNTTGIDASFVGTHNYPTAWQTIGLGRLSISWDRAMSPDASLRWYNSTLSAEYPQGVYNFYNSRYQTLTQYGGKVFAPLGGVSASGAVPLWAGTWYVTDMADWQAYAWQMASNYWTYAGLIQYFGIFNEPQQGKLPATNYISILTNGVPVIRAIAPTSKIVALGGSSTTDYIDQVMGAIDDNTRTNINVLDIHGYPPGSDPYSSGTSLPQALGWATNLISKYCTNGVTAWNSESGQWDWGAAMVDQRYPTIGSPVYRYQHNRPYMDGLIKVPWQMLQAASSYKAVGFERYFYYDSRVITASEWTDNHTGSWEPDDGHRPKIASLGVFNYFVAGTTGAGVLANVIDNIKILYFENGADSRAVIWSDDATPYDANMATVTPYDHFLTPKSYSGNHFQFGRILVYLVPNGLTSSQFRTVLTNATFTTISDTNAPGLSIFAFPGRNIGDTNRIRIMWSTTDEYSLPDKNNQLDILTRSKLSTDSDYDAWSTSTKREWSNVPNNITLTVQAKDAAGNISTATRTFVSNGGTIQNTTTIKFGTLRIH